MGKGSDPACREVGTRGLTSAQFPRMVQLFQITAGMSDSTRMQLACASAKLQPISGYGSDRTL